MQSQDIKPTDPKNDDVVENFELNIWEALIPVFALIIMYDATGVRRAVGKQAAILNQILDDIHHKKHIEQKKLKELIGHTPKEVLFGAILGILIAVVFA